MSAPGTFTLVADFEPQGDQPQAIDSLTEGLDAGRRHQVLLGVTGSPEPPVPPAPDRHNRLLGEERLGTFRFLP